MIEQKIICDMCGHRRLIEELNYSFFCFIGRHESSGLIPKKNLMNCFKHICKQCVVDIAGFAIEQKIYSNA